MAPSWEPDEIDFEDEYDKADPVDDANLDESINELNRSIREQEELENRIRRTEWSSMNEDERLTKLEHPASGEHDRTESRPDENIPLPPVTPVGGGQLGNQNVNRRHHSEE